MKTWLTKDEWMSLSSCDGDDRFTAEHLNDNDVQAVMDLCNSCRVRPECMAWAIETQACSVVVAGVRLPDPAFKRTLRRIYKHFAQALPRELAARGEDI